MCSDAPSAATEIDLTCETNSVNLLSKLQGFVTPPAHSEAAAASSSLEHFIFGRGDVVFLHVICVDFSFHLGFDGSSRAVHTLWSTWGQELLSS